MNYATKVSLTTHQHSSSRRRRFPRHPEIEFKRFKSAVRDTIDSPLLQELFPLGHVLKDVHWETHDGRTRLPVHLTEEHVGEHVHGRAGLTFGRQIGAYPILIGVPYHIPLKLHPTS